MQSTFYYRRGSPSHSDLNSQTSVQQVGTSSLAAATKKPSSAFSLTPSLSNYYKEQLVEHVQNWQADAAERQVGLSEGNL